MICTDSTCIRNLTEGSLATYTRHENIFKKQSDKNQNTKAMTKKYKTAIKSVKSVWWMGKSPQWEVLWSK